MRPTQCLRFKLVRNHIMFNNRYQVGRLRKVQDLRVRSDLEERGVAVSDPADVFARFPHLPPVPSWDYDHQADDPVRRAFAVDEAHPYYHLRPVWSFSDHTKYPRGLDIECAMNLCKTIKLKEGLPESLLSSIPKSGELFDGQHDGVRRSVEEAFLHDSTQKRLPHRKRIPYKEGQYHPVISKMNKGKERLPYEVKFRYQLNEGRHYGIPHPRRNANLIRGFLQNCDKMLVRPGFEHLLDRRVLEDCVFRQYFERREALVRTRLSVPFVVTAPQPLRPFAGPEDVAATENVPIVDLYPFNSWAQFDKLNVYRDMNNFPIRDIRHSAPHVVMGVALYNSRDIMWHDRVYTGRALTYSFMLALGQARLLHGPGIMGKDLPKPVCVQFVYTEGQHFHFSAFQLNTLRLSDDEGIKNIFWEGEPEDNWVDQWGDAGQRRSRLFDECEHIMALPQLNGYNPKVFNRFLAMYSQQ